MTRMFQPILLVLFALGALANSSGAQDCPNQGATQVKALIQDGPQAPGCDQYITVFGIRILLPGPRCSSYSAYYPARSVCAGRRQLRSDCVDGPGVLATIVTRACEPDPRSIHWLHAVSCVSTATVPLGVLRSGQETPCVVTCDPNGRKR